MSSIIELEKKWFRYRLKKIIPYALLGIVTIALIVLVLMIRFMEQKTATSFQSKSAIHKTTEKNETKVIIQQPTHQAAVTIQKNETQPVLQPSMGFIDNIGNSIVIAAQATTPKKTARKTIQKHSNHTNSATQKISKKKPQTVTMKRPQAVYKKSQPIQPVKKPQQTNAIIIQTTPVQKNMQDIIQRFKKTNNPMLSLFLAKRYYQQKKYTLAYNYALTTNQLDKHNDASWIIFAKSLVKLGQKKMAINTLEAYIKSSGSTNAKKLLQDIESGVFK